MLTYGAFLKTFRNTIYVIMAEVIPFKGILYDPQKVDATSVVAPPYDIVTPELRDELYKRSPFNIIRIDFGKDEADDNEHINRYTRASSMLSDWLRQGILYEDPEPSFYCYEIQYTSNNNKKTLKGLIGAVRLEKLGSGKIHTHEMTYSKPKADRLNILRFCRANISPIFSLYSSKEKITSRILENITRKKPFLEAKNGEGFLHRLWKINNRKSIEDIKKEMADKDIFIADGHHRYEVSLEFKREMEEKIKRQKSEYRNWNYVMMLLVNIEDNGLTILPTHRIASVKGDMDIKKMLSNYFHISTIPYDDSAITKAKNDMFKVMNKRQHSFGMLIKGQNAFHVLEFKGSYTDINTHDSLRHVDATILHKLIFEKILGIHEFNYEMDSDIVIQKVINGSFHIAFFLNPTKIDDVKKVALAGQRMPPKSTYFYPKLLTGMVLYKF
jgi:uncharacterized protein (DUF1015 family)